MIDEDDKQPFAAAEPAVAAATTRASERSHIRRVGDRLRTDAVDRVYINGLALPRALVRAMAEGRWRCPAGSLLRRVFREPPVQARLYDLAAMRERNRRWCEQKDPAFFGRSDDKVPPGDIEPARSLLLGELGPDMPFALDYRVSPAEPRVLYLHTNGDQWITIARDIEHLLSALRLTGSSAPP
jgi:hypothetical protein